MIWMDEDGIMFHANAEDYVDKLTDDKVLSMIAHQLRLAPEEERFHFISDLLDDPSKVGVALQLANRVLRKKEYFERILSSFR